MPKQKRHAAASPVEMIGQTYLPSVLRTVVPLIYAMLVRWGVVEWLDPENLFVTNLITVVVTALFYVLLRYVEQYWDKIGWLLGYGKQPVYVRGEVLTVDTVADPPLEETKVVADAGLEADEHDGGLR